MAPSQSLIPAGRIALAGLLGWLLPGLGHLASGHRKRGLIILVAITCTFWGGIAIGGVRHTVNPQEKKLWFLAQICNGTHAFAAYSLGNRSRAKLTTAELATSRWDSVEIAVVYTGVAGLLNVLAILDALMRADPSYRRKTAVVHAHPPRSAK